MTQPTEDSVIWLTQEAYDKLHSELDYLRGPARAEVTERIANARDEGDLRENGGYHAAKDEQGRAEARIRQLQEMLSRAQVGEATASGVVAPGTKVTVRFAGEDETESFLLGARELLDFDESVDLAVYSPQSPLGSAIVGKKKGETASYQAPGGAEVKVEVIDAEPFGG
ncbi:MAG: transcription elongation factor GreA [Propionibacteriales bacterium]|nr:transcription elongation factor GreA [Propionibacteriales bacterium]